MKFNGVRKSWLYLLEGRQKSPFAPVRNNLIRVIGMRGAHITSTETDVMYITQPIGFIVKDDEHALELKDDLARWLVTDMPVELEFDDEPGRVYFAKVEGTIDDFQKFVDQRKGVVTFIVSEGVGYGQEKTTDLSDAVIVNNEGTAEADPVFELTATKKTTFAMVSNGEEYNLIGKPADVDVQVVDEKTNIFDELGDTLDQWNTVSGSVGSYNSDSNGIYVSSYGTGSDWHGPTIEREITPTEDFEIEFFTNVRTEQDLMTFRTSLNFYDENMNELGLLRVWDKSNRRTAKIIEARIGPYTGVAHENYLISSNNYLWEGQRVYNGVIRVTRKGNLWTFYAAHITQRGNHIETITRTYSDKLNKFGGKLKFIRLNAAIFASNPKPNELSIRRVRVSKLNKLTVDQTPYILFPGDVVTFDHKNNDILVNGEPRNDLKNFGGSFFKLEKGNNTILVTPEDSFTGMVTYRDKYL